MLIIRINFAYKILSDTMEDNPFPNLRNQSTILIIKGDHINDYRILEIRVPIIDHTADSTCEQVQKAQKLSQQYYEADEETKTAIRSPIEESNQLRQEDVQLRAYTNCLILECKKIRQNWEPIFEDYQNDFIRINQQTQAITKNELNYFRSFPRAPPMIQFVLKPIYLLLQGDPQGLLKESRDTVEWVSIKHLLTQNFLERISKFHIYDVSKRVVDYVQREYLQADYWNLENIQKVSNTLFILARWAEHQIHLFEVLTMVQPFKQELIMMQEAGMEMEKQQSILAQRINELQCKLKPMVQQKQTLQKSPQLLQEMNDTKEYDQKMI